MYASSNYEGTNSQIEKISLDVMGSDSYPNEDVRKLAFNCELTCLLKLAWCHGPHHSQKNLTYFLAR